MTWYWNIWEGKHQGANHCANPPPHYYGNSIMGIVIPTLKGSCWGLKIRPLSCQALSHPRWFVGTGSRQLPPPKQILLLAVRSASVGEIPAVTVDIFRGLCQWLTQVAHCKFTLTVWENKQSCSDLSDVFCSCISASSLPAGCDPY